MNATRKRWLAIAGVGILAAGTSVSVWALGKAGPAVREKMVREMGQKIAASARLEGDRAAKFVKSWERQAGERQQTRQAVRQAMKDVVKASREDSEASGLKKALDELQSALAAALEGQGKTIDTLRKELSPAEQSRVLLARKGHKVLRLPGMKEALPALAGFIRGEVLTGTPGLATESRQSLESIGKRYAAKRSELIQNRMALMEKLEKAGSEAAGNQELLDQIARNTDSLRHTVGEQLAEVRKQVPDAELAKVVAGLAKKAHGIRERAKAWRGGAEE